MIVDLSNIYSGFSDKLRVITFYIAINKLKKNELIPNQYRRIFNQK